MTHVIAKEDVLAVIEHLRVEGGKKFSLNTLDAARHFYRGEPQGQWSPQKLFFLAEMSCY